MIKANEIMLGNIYFDQNDNYHLWKVEDFQHKTMFTDNQLWFIPFKPVELTPKILEKCGFEIIYNEIDIIIKKRIEGISMLKFAYFKEDGYLQQLVNECICVGIPFKLLHQFQNRYFSLTGEELTINL
jgi:hypothetical protein